ncbi:DEAD/DEAH box helicase family protein [Alkalicoccobacillus murimartini]|uniref:Competence protein ComFA n=1 Tax=Alkalicoccobacillus murimartini TaxID=171685 RepID=A0ABT9YHU3_9BACI|nr:DEAD/DEAH box helicase family protein [Alkalicoccobacillus murimartini]MDQ0206772.1 competence protein ComFA [Alkalicoccobacillus murimartini]
MEKEASELAGINLTEGVRCLCPDSQQMVIPWEPLRRHLAGRRLTLNEIPFPRNILHEHQKAGYIQHSPGILNPQTNAQCQRCGNTNPSLFAQYPSIHSVSPVSYCRNCLSLGKISSSTNLYSWIGPSPSYVISSKPLQWSGKLSTGQSFASKQVIRAIRHSLPILVWAVCGAGKTEVLFHGIELALQEGKRVLLATPRTDVVKELAPRFKKAFPGVVQAVLYGGHTKEETTAPLILATTHQAMRFYQAFDVVIVDEVDAFPYSYDSSLQYAVLQAEKPNATRVYLSATPAKALLRQKRLTIVRIPRRYHGYHLPVPRMSWCGNWRKRLNKGKLPKGVEEWIRDHVKHQIPALLFVPSISVLQQVSEVLTTQNILHEAVY